MNIALSSESFVFDPDGDIRIKVTVDGNECFGRVNSQAMRLASPVWAKFIFPPWAPLPSPDSSARKLCPCYQKNDQMKADIWQQKSTSQDDCNAIYTLLSIVHFKFENIPKENSLTYQHSMSLAVLCDQYLCVHLIKPFLPLWMKDLIGTVKNGRGKPNENWLYITLIFGSKKDYQDLAIWAVQRSRINDRGLLQIDAGIEFKEPIETVQNVRLDIITSLLGIFYSMIDTFATSAKPKCRDSLFACDALHYGTICRNLQKGGLWPRVKAEDVSMSVDNLRFSLGKYPTGTFVEFREETNRRPARGYSHESCDEACRVGQKLLNVYQSIEKRMAKMEKQRDGHVAKRQKLNAEA
ncbi:hypothetical protein B0J14DRAFT_570632 [Halenospora varia]|nr:hypothetical protein B0J14DRAFT_570632 [Halenospora varia]